MVIWTSEDGCETPTASSTFLTASTATNPNQIKLLFSASDDHTVRVWDLRTNTCVRVLHSHVAQVQSLQVMTVDIAHNFNVPVANTFPGLADGPTEPTGETEQETAQRRAREQITSRNRRALPAGFTTGANVTVNNTIVHPARLAAQVQAQQAQLQAMLTTQAAGQPRLSDLGLESTKPLLVTVCTFIRPIV